ncbi:glycosyltransferase [Pseudomonas sp. 21LCFQ02]|uniref:glycosyltransferase n=1 Tax=unclassified Pseudomonas TaxID=196821 RepID=UPI0004F9079C|nr:MULTISPECIES: glycosyltransferase [unclassified Pseudomonas]MCO8171011.1 glycosyltransferase [Pseudomonas sp. 21LCFQ02]MCQ9425620.1 glycosyltransferase [Pseudomonas sp. LJDD11]BAP46046.1 glycosyl transferase group 1 [Pseudomonas sp. StFLB209]
MTRLRIDQLTPSVAAGDGVTNGLLFTQSLLRELGYDSDIYCHYIPESMTGKALPATTFKSEGCSLLLYHHSMGHDYAQWLYEQDCPKALVYHNITPPEFFPPDSWLQQYALLGLRQLEEWREFFPYALADSPLNERELIEKGYTNTKTLPLLVDTRRLEGEQQQPAFMADLPEGTIFYLAIGRLAENKRQYLLIEAYYHLRKLQAQSGIEQPPQRLMLVGGTTSADYATALQFYIDDLGLKDEVILAGKCSDAELHWMYHNAHQYWCASAHEGFCMPLLEANYASLPVVTQARSNIPATLGEGGLLLDSDDPLVFASASNLLNTEPGLREKIIAAGHRNLQRYEHDALKTELQQWLAQLDCLPSAQGVTLDATLATDGR